MSFDNNVIEPVVFGSESGNPRVPELAMAPRSYILPDILRNWPYESIINPFYHAAQAESAASLEHFYPFNPKQQKLFNKCDIGLLCGFTYPRATHYDLRSCCDLMLVFYILDEYTDVLDTEGSRIHCEATMDAILHPDKQRPHGEPITGEIARQFWKRASLNVPQATKERFYKYWRCYLDSVILQAQHRQESRYFCTIEEYMIARRDNIGTYPSFVFLEISLGLGIPHHIMEHPFLVDLNKDTSDMIMLANDMCSYKKEILTNSADYNAVTVVMKHKNTDVATALQWISDTHDELVKHFLKVRDDVLERHGFPSYGEELDRQIAAYVHGLGQWIRGHDEWNFSSGRYFGDEGLAIQRSRKVVIV